MSESRVTLRPEIEAMVPYRQGKQAAADAFKLSSNENPYGPLPAVVEALARTAANRYPDSSALVLRERLAERWGVTPDEVHVGAGSASILTQLALATSGPGDEVVYAWRSFEAYPGMVTVAGATSVQVPNTVEDGHDLPAMAAAVTDRTRLILVCSPNNPTGTIVTRAQFAEFMAAVPPSVLVVLDEAYIEFVTHPDAVRGEELVGRYPNLVVLRTFSKAYGLAGLRVGYAIGPEYVLDAARATAIPLSVTEPAQVAALASIEHEAELLARVSEITERRDALWSALVAQGWDSPKPQGNFIWLPTGSATAEVAEAMFDDGLVVRALGDGVRVSVGEPESVEPLLRSAAPLVEKVRAAVR